ncbi:amidase family protein [Georgenia faecalis]|uniref:Amidase family protein n=1 Tax=Georgenia faecalis TaxID=2483799 RepID=A0ABV9D9C4_9MICO|nr:amidase [Georgenia faecalis]
MPHVTPRSPARPTAPRGRLTAAGCAAALAVAGLSLTGTAASAVSDVTTAGEATFTIHDAYRPGLDTGSIRSLSASRLEGFGNLFLQVAGGDDRMNGQMLRGFGVTSDGAAGFDSTRSVLVDGVQVARTLDVVGESARFFDTLTNTTSAPLTVRVSFGGSLGYGTGENAGTITGTADGDTVLEPGDTWVTSDPARDDLRPVGIVVGQGVDALGDQQADPFTDAYEATGSRANHPGFVHELTLEPGQTQSLLSFVVAGAAQVGALEALTGATQALAAAPDAAGLPVAAQCTVVNWDLLDDASCAAAGLLAVPSADTSTLASEVATTTAGYDVTGATIADLQADLRAGLTTSVEITQAYLDRIAAYDGGALGFRSYITVAENALAQAAAADAARAAGADGDLLGIPLGIKDLYDTADMPTTGGTLALEGYRPAADAWQVARLREAGAVILGKTNLSEFANSGSYSESGFMQTWNALYPSKSSHGSSGGSGTAVAADLAAGAMGSQTGVSLYAPATSAGLATFRGTDGLSSAQGVMPLTWAQDYAGPMAKTVTDLAALLDATATRTTGNNPADLLTARVDNTLRPESFTDGLDATALEGKVLGIIPTSFVSTAVAGDPTGPAARAALERLAAEAGATVVEVPAPAGFERAPGGDRGAEGWERYIADQVAFPYADGDALLSSDLVLPYNARDRDTEPMTDAEVEAYLDWRDRYKAHVAAWMDEAGVDAVVYPGFISAVGNNDVSSATHTSDRATGVLTSTAGLPTVVVPVGASPLGESMSLQLLGRAWTDADVLAMGYALEQEVTGRVTTAFAPALPADAGDVATRVDLTLPDPAVVGRPAQARVRVVALGSAVPAGPVVLEVAGRTFTGVAGPDGVTFDLPTALPVGQYEVTITYVGDAATEGSEATAMLTVAEVPTEEPTEPPSEEPTEEPTGEPTEPPTEEPTEEPPTEAPTEEPTGEPTTPPVGEPSAEPTVEEPTGGAPGGGSPTDGSPAAPSVRPGTPAGGGDLPSTGVNGIAAGLAAALALLLAGGVMRAVRRGHRAG